MKKFFKGRWFPLIVAIGITAVVAFMMALFGWRVTYAPELENSWDAVSAVAAWAGVFSSFIAIWFAIQVPKKIAEQQDKISLFEKRYQLFSMLAKWRFLSEQIVTLASNNDDARKFFSILYGENDNGDRLLNNINLTYRYIISEISQIYFLFGIKENMHPTLLSLVNTTAKILMGNNFEGQKNQLRETLGCKEIEEIFSIMQKELTISQ